jgi:hypothetical protein
MYISLSKNRDGAAYTQKEVREGERIFRHFRRRNIGGPMTDKTSSFSTWFRIVRDRKSLGMRARQ